jgi:AcrR family transcriptional regulator
MTDHAPPHGPVQRSPAGPAASERPAREAILDAARRQFGANPSRLSIQAVAAESGLSRQTVHHYFGGLRGLRSALAAEGLDTATAQDEPTRDRLIDAAVRILSRPGGGFVSIGAISTEAGLTKGAFYHHFTDRAELLRAVAHRVSPVEEMKARLVPDMDGSARDGLIAIARAYYEAISPRADLIRNLASNASRDPELTAIVMNEIVGQGAPLLFIWFGMQASRGALRPVDPSLVAQMLFGPVLLLVVMGREMIDRMAERGVHSAIDNVEAYVDLVLNGIAQAPINQEIGR